MVTLISWFDDTNENHENLYSTSRNEFTIYILVNFVVNDFLER